MATAYQMYFNPATNREIPFHGNRYRPERYALVPYKLVGVQKMSSTSLGTATVPWRLTGFFFKRGRRIQPIATLNLCNTPPIRFPLSTHPQIFYIKWKKSTQTRGCIEYPNPFGYPGKRQQRRHIQVRVVAGNGAVCDGYQKCVWKKFSKMKTYGWFKLQIQ